jgi:two-component system chemotaxis response regulator CheY
MFDPKTKVLVIDDMVTMRKLVMKICREIGFSDISEAGSVADAWEKITNATPPYGLIISDWNMPNSTGLDLLKRVRADSRFAKLPFVMVTAEAEKHQITSAVEAGVTHYVVKPFTADILRAKLEAAHKKVA